jgi:hydroxymethylbilane synthase
MRPLVVGTRGSQLALAQTQWVVGRLRELDPESQVETRIIRTTGDHLATASLVSLAGSAKGLFVKEIEEALLAGAIDLAVHSMKDLPSELPAGLTVGVVPQREDPRDALLAHTRVSGLAQLPAGARIGTSSPRRMVQVRHRRPDVEVVPLRGNVDTRLRKLESDNLDGIILAAAGLRRLGLQDRITCLFTLDEMIPAVGQGALAVEVRADDVELIDFLGPLEDYSTRASVNAEREFLRLMGGGCQLPLGAHAAVAGGFSVFSAFLAAPDGGELIQRSATGPAGEIDQLVAEVAEFFLQQGAADLLHRTNP